MQRTVPSRRCGRGGSADADNALSLALLRNAAEQITYAPIHEDGMTNQVDVTIR